MNYAGETERAVDLMLNEIILRGQRHVDEKGQYCFGAAVGKMQGTMNGIQEDLQKGKRISEIYREMREERRSHG